MFSIKDYLNRARYLINNEGIFSLVNKIFTSYIFMTGRYYIREHFVGDLNEANFLPDTRDFTFKLITDNEQADALAEQIGCDFRNQILHARERLTYGAVAFCIFIDNTLAAINWVAFTPVAKKLINPLPFRVDFAGGQACSSQAETVPKYRSKGLMAYLWYQRNLYMKEQGLAVLIGTDAISNKAILNLQDKIPSRVSAIARYTCFFGWRFWKESPVMEGFQPPGIGKGAPSPQKIIHPSPPRNGKD